MSRNEELGVEQSLVTVGEASVFDLGQVVKRDFELLVRGGELKTLRKDHLGGTFLDFLFAAKGALGLEDATLSSLGTNALDGASAHARGRGHRRSTGPRHRGWRPAGRHRQCTGLDPFHTRGR